MTSVVVSPNTVNDNNWYPDSSTTDHITSDLNNLDFGCECHGKNKLHVGNGASFQIKYIGHSIVSPSTSFLSRFHLKNLTCSFNHQKPP